jgi:PAS domain-containing protein
MSMIAGAAKGLAPGVRRSVRRRGRASRAAAAPVRAAESPAVDIERSRHERALRELEASESYSRALFHATQTGLIIADPRTEFIMDVNRTAAAILGATGPQCRSSFRPSPCPIPKKT